MPGIRHSGPLTTRNGLDDQSVIEDRASPSIAAQIMDSRPEEPPSIAGSGSGRDPPRSARHPAAPTKPPAHPPGTIDRPAGLGPEVMGQAWS